MTADLIRLEVLATALQISNVAVRAWFASGKLPAPDASIDLRTVKARPLGTRSAMAWRLDTLERWNPAIAARCAAIQRALADCPLTEKAA